MENKIILLLQNEKFLSKLNDASTSEEIQSIFKNEGIDISLDKAEIIMESLLCVDHKIYGTEEMSQEELQKIGGGTSSVKNSLEYVMMCTIVSEGSKNGGINYELSKITEERTLKQAKKDVISWIEK